MRAVSILSALALGLSSVAALAQAGAQDPSLEPLPGLDLPGIEDLLPEQFGTDQFGTDQFGTNQFDIVPDEPSRPPARAPEAAPPAAEAEPQPAAPPPVLLTREERLDKLFADLKRESNTAAAGRIAQRIESEWADSGSATVDLLVDWAGQAIAKDDKPAAFDLLGEAIAMKPDFAESWNRRATLHYLADDYGKAFADIEQTLAREPRHYGALMGLGAILEATDRKQQALEAYAKALEIFPAMKPAQDAVGRLSEELSGRAI